MLEHVGARRHEHEAKRREHRRQHGEQLEREWVWRSSGPEFRADGAVRLDVVRHEPRQDCLRFVEGHARAYPNREREFPRLRRPREIVVDDAPVRLQRKPHVARRVVKACELRSQHANDREGAPVQLERAAEHSSGSAIEHPHPGSMTEHGRSALRRVSIEIGERTADLQPWRQRPEVAAGHEHGIETAKARGERPGALCDDRVEQVASWRSILRLLVAM